MERSSTYELIEAIHKIASKMFLTSIKDRIVIIGGASLPLKSSAFKDRFTRDLDLDVIGLDNEVLKRWAEEELTAKIKEEVGLDFEVIDSNITKGNQLKLTTRYTNDKNTFQIKIDFGVRTIKVEPIELDNGIKVSSLIEDIIRKVTAVTKGGYMHAKHVIDLYMISGELTSVHISEFKKVLDEFDEPKIYDILSLPNLNETLKELDKIAKNKGLAGTNSMEVLSKVHRFIKGLNKFRDNVMWNGEDWVWVRD